MTYSSKVPMLEYVQISVVNMHEKCLVCNQRLYKVTVISGIYYF